MAIYMENFSQKKIKKISKNIKPFFIFTCQYIEREKIP